MFEAVMEQVRRQLLVWLGYSASNIVLSTEIIILSLLCGIALCDGAGEEAAAVAALL
jgi:hypothetical protein